MSDIATTFEFTSSSDLVGRIRVPSGTTASPTGLTFYFTDGSYLNALIGDLTDVIYFSFPQSPSTSDAFIFDLTTMQTYFSLGGDNYEDYFGADSTTSSFTISEWKDGLYKYEAFHSSSDDIQWLLHVPTVEAKLVILAKQILDSQCKCTLNTELSEKFVKAKAYQELIYNKVIGLSREENMTTLDTQAILTEVNSMVQTLINFLNGTDTICGC